VIDTVGQLDLATWPFIVRPADEAIRRLNGSPPTCPKHGGRTNRKSLDQYGMCPSCWRTWTAHERRVTTEDVTPEARAAIREQAHRGRYNAREKTWVSPALDTLAREANRAHPVEGKQYDIALIAYLLTHPDPDKPQPRPTRINQRDLTYGVRCKRADEVDGMIHHELCRSHPWCICPCHGGRA
jgi:hypothetical protein